MNQFIAVKSPFVLINEYKGKRLITKNYQSDPEMDYFLGDLLLYDRLIFAIGEVESGESDFTPEGKEFLKYLYNNSDVGEKLIRDFFSENYIKDFDDLLKYKPLTVDQTASSRLFNPLSDPSVISSLSAHLGIDIHQLYPKQIRDYDIAIKKINDVFNETFLGENFQILRNFRVRFTSNDKSLNILLNLNKINFLLTINPTIKIHEYIISPFNHRISFSQDDQSIESKLDLIFGTLKDLIIEFADNVNSITDILKTKSMHYIVVSNE